VNKRNQDRECSKGFARGQQRRTFNSSAVLLSKSHIRQPSLVLEENINSSQRKQTETETRMRQLKRIIVGHDLGGGGEVALRSAVVLANRFGAALRLVHVVEPLDSYQRISHPLTSPYTLEEIAQKTGVRLQALVASAELAPLQVEYEVRRGKPFVELIIAGRAWLADLIVVGGASRTEEPFLGRTSERILRKALVPVMVAKKPLSSEAKTFLVPTDFSSCARKAAEEALILAKCFGGRVVFFHVLDLHPSYTIAYAHELGVSVPIPPPSPEEIEKLSSPVCP
jgi:nucleotide-binding universal stress UspA family protein